MITVKKDAIKVKTPEGMQSVGVLANVGVVGADPCEFGESYWIENLNGRQSYTYLFANWKSPRIPFIDLSKGTNLQNFLYNSEIEELPAFDISSAKHLASFLWGCKKLKRTPLLNALNCTTFNNMCRESTLLESFEIENTSKGTTFESMFNVCSSIKSIKTLDLSSATNVTNIVHLCRELEEIRFVEGTIKISIKFDYCSKLSAESIQNIIEGLATVTTAQTITFHKDIEAKLSDEQKAQITSKNWTIAFSS